MARSWGQPPEGSRSCSPRTEFFQEMRELGTGPELRKECRLASTLTAALGDPEVTQASMT